MKYEGYTIAQDKDGSWRVSVDGKVVNVGLHSEENAKTAVDVRIARRTRMGRDAVG